MPPVRVPPVSPRRDSRLDVARGFALFVIFVAHMPMNPFAGLVPARFGFSDSAEIFVFCSGVAAALAFAQLFETHGLVIGAARVALRIWQLYWAHIALFLLVVTTNVVFDHWTGSGTSYVDGFNLGNVIGPHAGQAIVGLFTLTYVPNYFDILPMYMVLLALVPLVVVVSRHGTAAVLALVIGLWLIAGAHLVELPAEPWGHRSWFFNPFSWQLVFFTGFAFARGWLPVPGYDRRLVAIAVGVLVFGFLLTWEPLVERAGYPASLMQSLAPMIDKTHAAPLRYLHFLSLAYVAFVLAGEGGRRLKGKAVDVCRIAGRQALAVFLTGLWLSVVCGYLLQQLGGGALGAVVVNAGGIAAMTTIAWLVGWFKSEPWRMARKPMPEPSPAPAHIESSVLSAAH